MSTTKRRQYAGDEAPLLAERVQEVRGDARLTAWEENFLASIAERLRSYGERTAISQKQAATLAGIQQRLAAPPANENADNDEQESD